MKFKKICLLAGVMLIFLLCVTGCSQDKKFEVKIKIPAGSTAPFVYSDEEVSSRGNSITLSSGEGLCDTQVVLKPVEAEVDNANQSAYLTPGIPVKLQADKGKWFKVGVSLQNSTSEDIDVYVCVENVEIRIE